MKTNLYLFAICSVILSSCGTSKTPAESDVTNILKEQFVNCPIIEIKNVKKINGAPSERENYYNIKATFDLVFKPISENTEQWNEFSKKMALRKSIEAEFDIAYKAIIEKKDKLKDEFDAKSKVTESAEARSENYQVFLQQIAQLDAEKAENLNLQSEKINKLGLAGAGVDGLDGLLNEGFLTIRKSCKVDGLGSQLAGRAYMTSNDSLMKRAEFMGTGGTISYTVDWLMMKTEQGWQLKL